MPEAQMTVVQYDELLLRMNAEVDLLKEKMRKIRKARDQQAALEEAEAKLAAMSDLERAAMAKVIQAGPGAPSQAAAGTPGT